MLKTRTKKMHDKYKRYQQANFRPGWCSFCDVGKDKAIKTFRYWKIINNWFPWDRLTKTHHLLVPKRHTSGSKLTALEKSELEKIKAGYLNKKYDILAEATDRIKSIPGHFHLHLI